MKYRYSRKEIYRFVSGHPNISPITQITLYRLIFDRKPAEPKEKCADTTSCKHHLPTSACVKCTPKLPEKVDFVKLETKVKNGRNALIELTIENTLNGIITYLERTTK